MLMVDDTKDHIMRAHLVDDGYVTLAWPKNLTLKHLELMRTCVNLQIDTFIHSARRESEKEEAARLEYESWKVGPVSRGELPCERHTALEGD